MNAAEQWTDLAGIEQMQDRDRLLCRLADGLEILLLRQDQQLLALSNRCPHQGRPLDRGRISNGSISCPFHGACFDLRSGKALSGPAGGELHRFDLRLESGRILIDVSRRPIGFPSGAVPPAA